MFKKSDNLCEREVLIITKLRKILQTNEQNKTNLIHHLEKCCAKNPGMLSKS